MKSKTISGYGVDITGMDFETPVFKRFVKDHAPTIYNDYLLDILDDCIFPDVIIKLQDYKADGVFDYGYGAIITASVRKQVLHLTIVLVNLRGCLFSILNECRGK